MEKCSIALTGDVMLGRLFNESDFIQSLERRSNTGSPWGHDILDIMNRVNVVSINLETTIIPNSICPDPLPKTFNYRMLPKHVRWLKEIHVNHASIANNHILDYKSCGMYETIKQLHQNKILHTGAGENLTDAIKARFVVCNELTIGFMSAADHYKTWKATVNKPGIFYMELGGEISNQVTKAIKHAREKCDILIFSYHWGSNWEPSVPEEMREKARQLSKLGVDVIQGHSAHHVLPVEEINTMDIHGNNRKTIVFYSLGDFIDDYAVNKKYRSDLGAIAILNFTSSNIEYDILPTSQNRSIVSLAKGNDKSWVLDKML
jgi:poly-gamma-glutamate synthesis protein (capsule biosynthesis protein)